MSNYRFDVIADTVPANEFEYAGRQREMAEHYNVARVFSWRDIRGNVFALPKYVKAAIAAAGYEAVCLGGTTYSHSVIGLVKK